MESKERETTERPEFWLEYVLCDLDSNREFFRDGSVKMSRNGKVVASPGVYLFAVRLLSMIECREIPTPDMTVTKEGNYILDWSMKNGDRLFISIVGNNRWRYILSTLRTKDDSLHVVDRNHADRIRAVFEEMFMVNSVPQDRYVKAIEGGEFL